MIKRVFDEADRVKKQGRIPRKASSQAEPSPELTEVIRTSTVDGFLPCASAFEVARKLKIPLVTVGDTADELGIRVVDCQLGCFKVKKAVHDLSGKTIRADIAEAVESEMAKGPLTCAGIFGVARRLKVRLVEIADAANHRHIKIYHCQLGCF